MLGQRPDRDKVDTGFRHRHQGLVADAAGGFQPGPSGHPLHCRPHVLQGELIEHDDVRARGQGLIQLVQVFGFHFHRPARGDAAGFGDGGGDGAAGGDVVFLDQEGIPEADAVIVAAAAGNGVLLSQPQPGQGLAGIEQTDLGVGHPSGVVSAAGGDAGQCLQPVQGGPFGGEQAARRTRQGEQHLVGLDPVAIVDPPVQPHRRVHLTEHLVHPGPACHHCRFPGNHPPRGLFVGGDQAGGNVTFANILAQALSNGFDSGLAKQFGWQHGIVSG